MNPRKIGPLASNPLRRFPIFHSTPASLPNYRLVFDVPGLPPEPSFANLLQAYGSTVHGVLHWIARPDFDLLALSEGVFSVPFIPSTTTQDVTVTVQNPQGDSYEISAKTFVFKFRVSSAWRPFLKPSRRYLQLAVDGAQYWGVYPPYVDIVLKNIDYDRGLLGGFGLFVEPRPHLLDRPNPDAQFGNMQSEVYSPWEPIRSKEALRKFEQAEKEVRVTESRLRMVRVSSVEGKRKLFFVPGVDGTGKGIVSQVDGFDEDGEYDVRSVVYPHSNRQSIEELGSELIEMFLKEAEGEGVSVVGESMGGAVATAVALENVRRKERGERALDIDLILLINPATCYGRSTPRALWDFLLSLKLPEESYTALLPIALLPFIVDVDSVRHDFGPRLFPRLRTMLLSLSNVADLLPQEALVHRLQLLSKYSVSSTELVKLSGPFGPKDFAVISAYNDNLLPSLSENYRMQRCIPNMYSAILSYGGHSPSFDKRFSLVGHMKPFKKMSSDKKLAVRQSNVNPKLEERRAAMRKRFAAGSPEDDVSGDMSRGDIRRLMDYLARYSTDASPIFIGEENLPDPNDGKPVLFVCNHTILGWVDAMYPTLRLLQTKKKLLRSLAHPSLFRSKTVSFPNTTTVSEDDMKKFGLVQVGPRVLLELFAKGQWCLLFPGGAREVLRHSGEPMYSVIWQESPEFVRACALFGATVVPLSTVGTEDMVNIVADSHTVAKFLQRLNDLLGSPVDFDDIFLDSAKQWRGATVQSEEAVMMVPPLVFPKGADRLYFRFGKPIEVPGECLDNPVLERQIYKEVRAGVAEGIDILLRRREADLFRSKEKRSEFTGAYGSNIEPPASPAWSWSKGSGAYLDEDLQPPL